MSNAVFSMERTAIREVRVAGEPLQLESRPALEAFRAAMRRLSLAVPTFMLDSKRSSILVTKAPSLIVYFETLPVGAGSDTAPMVASGLYGPAVRRRYMATGVAPSTGGGSVVVSSGTGIPARLPLRT